MTFLVTAERRVDVTVTLMSAFLVPPPESVRQISTAMLPLITGTKRWVSPLLALPLAYAARRDLADKGFLVRHR